MSESLVVYLTQVASFLKVPAGKIALNTDLLPTRTHKNTTTSGFANIIFALIKESGLELSPKSPSEELEVRQWLEFYVVYVLHGAHQQNATQILEDVNKVFLTRTYLMAQRLTIADVVLYYFLQNLMSCLQETLTHLDKEKYLNVSRWFDNIQQNSSVRQSHKLVDFSTNYLVMTAPSRH